MMPSKKYILVRNISITIATVVCIVAIGLTSISNRIERLNLLRSSGRNISAVVTATECANHGSIRYRFDSSVGNVDAISNSCGIPCSSVKAGDRLSILFSQDDPSVNECGSIETKMSEQLTSVYMLFGLCAFILLVCAIKCIVDMRALSNTEKN